MNIEREDTSIPNLLGKVVSRGVVDRYRGSASSGTWDVSPID